MMPTEERLLLAGAENLDAVAGFVGAHYRGVVQVACPERLGEVCDHGLDGLVGVEISRGLEDGAEGWAIARCKGAGCGAEDREELDASHGGGESRTLRTKMFSRGNGVGRRSTGFGW